MQIPVLRDNPDSSTTEPESSITMPAFIHSSRATAPAPTPVPFHPQPVQPPSSSSSTSSPSPFTTTITIPQTLDPSTWYRIHNKYATFPLDVVNDGQGSRHGNLTLAHIGNYSGQHWQITPVTSTSTSDLTTSTFPPIIPPNTYTLRTLFLGPARPLATDHTTRNKPHLSEPLSPPRQSSSSSSPASQSRRPHPHSIYHHWTITLQPDGRSFKLQNLSAGPELCLDTRDGGAGNEVCMAEVDASRLSQRWYFTPIGPVEEEEGGGDDEN